MATELKLKPCPFCGSKPSRKYKHYFNLNHKKDCILAGVWPYIHDHKETIAAWNKREVSE